MTDGGGTEAGAIEVTTGYMVLAFLLAAFKTRVAIDGHVYELPWGTNTFPVNPGRHRVRVSFKYLIPSDAGGNEVDVDVKPGETVRVGYRAPWLVFLTGKAHRRRRAGPGRHRDPGSSPRQSAAAASAGAAPDWYPDPSQRHELRYWDGQTWTPNVSDQGVVGIDPPG